MWKVSVEERIGAGRDIVMSTCEADREGPSGERESESGEVVVSERGEM